MNKNISTDKLVGAGIIIGVIIMVVWVIFSGIHKAKEQLSQPVEKEVIKEEETVVEPGYTISRNIFPTDDEAKENIKKQLERQETLDKTLTEKKQTMADVRKDVEVSLNEQPTSTAEEAHATNGSQPATKQVTTTFADEQKKLTLQKGRVAALKNKELFVHH
ncbi:MAG: hypothetical protein NTZ95_01165 [Candidatus Omnitrophica bacterium]|nr:hypothetical protein [Candidatus Omnitrophota bacterium]